MIDAPHEGQPFGYGFLGFLWAPSASYPFEWEEGGTDMVEDLICDFADTAIYVHDISVLSGRA